MGPAGGQVVGGGAGGGGDDEPVGPVDREVFPVDPGGHLGDAGQGAFVDHRVVQDVFLPGDLALAEQGDGEHHALFHLKFAGEHMVGHAGVKFVQGDFGEKPQAPQVDPEDGHAPLTEVAGHAQDGAVTPHDHDELHVVRQRRDQGFGLVFEMAGFNAAPFEPGF